ncbi:MAG TPA: 2-hydroxychromene-2-carboxylate isomerase [Rubrobacteraceae bacterium]|nr:2-hydroxychromene-2-carboxylate isomerase [Rubrobacteraceae bacterium]
MGYVNNEGRPVKDQVVLPVAHFFNHQTHPSGPGPVSDHPPAGLERKPDLRAMVNVPELQFWFEFGSTYSYLSAARIEDAAASAGVTVSWEPFLLGPIFKDQGWDDSPFNVYPAKGQYMWRDLERLCAGYGLPFAKPSRFPRSGLLAARVACLAKSSSEPWLPDFARAIYRANFAEDREIGDSAVVCSILDSLGQPGAQTLERSEAQEIKTLLREQTRRAVEIGIFGAPSFVVGDELFWGNDRLEDALAWAGSRTEDDKGSRRRKGRRNGT